MLQELIEKRNKVLGSIKEVHDELTEVNSQISIEVEENNKRMLEIQKETNSLGVLKTQNANSIKALKKILGE